MINNNTDSTSTKLKDQNVPSEPKPKYLCNDLKEKHVATHPYNLRPRTRNNLDANNNIVTVKTSSLTSETCTNNGGAVKRGYDFVDAVDGETEDDLAAFPSSYMSGRKSPAKKAKFLVTLKEMNDFFHLLKDNSINEFLKRDACCLISDKYALAMVFTYFKRARYTPEEFTICNFYLALYLASDIEEDVDEYKYEIFPWALGPKWRSKFSSFLRKRDALLKRIGYRAIVSRKCCEEVMGFVSDHYAWKRERSEDHGGATRAYLITRGRRLLSSKSNLEDEELNLPRGPHEKPRPCPLCFVNRMNVPKNPPPPPSAPTVAKFTGQTLYYSSTLITTQTIHQLPLILPNRSSYANESSDADNESSLTSGYGSNESHVSSSFSSADTLSSDNSYCSNLDATLTSSSFNNQNKNKDDFLLNRQQEQPKQVKTPKKLYINSTTHTNNVLIKDLNNNEIEFDAQKTLINDSNNSFLVDSNINKNNVVVQASYLNDLNSNSMNLNFNINTDRVTTSDEEADGFEDEDEDDEEDEVFTSSNEKTQFQLRRQDHLARLNQRRSFHHNNQSKKKANFSLSEHSASYFNTSTCSSSNTSAIYLNSSSISSEASINLTHIKFNDQLVPRELLVKNLI